MDAPTCAKDAVDRNSIDATNNSKWMARIRIRSPLADYQSAASVSTFVYLLVNLDSPTETHRRFIDSRTRLSSLRCKSSAQIIAMVVDELGLWFFTYAFLSSSFPASGAGLFADAFRANAAMLYCGFFPLAGRSLSLNCRANVLLFHH